MTHAVDFAALKVLVIDDQEFVRTIVKKMLLQLDVGAVVEASDGNSGLEAVIRERPDLVICDIQMRPMDGFGFVKMLRATPGVADLPVIMLTAHTDAGTVNRAKDLGIGAFLGKPVLPPALKDKILHLMSTARANA